MLMVSCKCLSLPPLKTKPFWTVVVVVVVVVMVVMWAGRA
jgi:hypothetical protein